MRKEDLSRMDGSRSANSPTGSTASANEVVPVETCGTCGHVGPSGNPHDCYWVSRERMGLVANRKIRPCSA
jgi:hypothetical protein